MPLSWNEIKERATRFSKEWEMASNEDAEAKTFLYEFFNVFGISQRKVSTFEHRVKKLDEREGYIDLFWKGMILIEMKSKGKDLDKALIQAKDYLHNLPQHELPKYILVSDFERFRLIDMEEDTTNEFKLNELYKNVKLFGLLAGYLKRIYKEEDPVNVEAAYLMGKLHDALKDAGYTGHELEKYLVRLLFCLFADDTTIFELSTFQLYIEDKTNEDGSDLGLHLAQIFQVLNTPIEKRQKTLDESLAAFPYVNGQLFAEQLSFASFNSKMRQTLLDCCHLDWSKISPAIFGSMFQSVMNPVERRNLGAHYTSEKNILKLIKPLFLDELWNEFETVKSNSNKLKLFHNKIASLRFLDPACGCGNFLVITYRELRLLEMEVVKKLLSGQQVTNIRSYLLVDVDRFYGIEYEEFPAQIAQVAMWLMDHQMNMQAVVLFGQYFNRLPLTKSANIVQGNALQIDWDSLLNPEKTITIYAEKLQYIESKPTVNETTLQYKQANVYTHKAEHVEKFTTDPLAETIKYDYVLGNPPFIGKQMQNSAQKQDMELVFNGVKGAGVLDYVCSWYIRAAQYLQKYNSGKSDIKCAFVSTNSISQGEQVGILWNELFNRYKIKIHFAHRTFKWGNEAKGNAAVHVVIIGFSNFDITEKFIYEYEDIKGEPHEITVRNINPYLVEGKDLNICKRRQPICNVPEISFGSMPNDGGYLVLSDEEKHVLLNIEPGSQQYIKELLSAYEYLNGIKRWCLWLQNANPTDIRKMPEISKRVENVRKIREASTRDATKKLAAFPSLFGEIRQPNSNYILIPRHSSENRKYIPFGFFDKDSIASDSCLFVTSANFYHFGVLSSIMHMTWNKYTCGRIKSDFRYSNEMVYNNFPWPENITVKQKENIEKAAKEVLSMRTLFPDNSLADLYDPNFMPPALVKAHNELDKAVDLAYRPQPFINETKRIEFLFELYDKYTAGLFGKEQVKRKKGKK